MTHNPNCAIVRSGDIRAWCDCGKGDGPMTNDKELVERLRGDWPEILVEKHWMMDSDAIDKQREEAADRIEALSEEIERLREALEKIEAGTYPRPLGKSWRMDLSSSKHDSCIHDIWMYETCDECLDAFIREALGETK